MADVLNIKNLECGLTQAGRKIPIINQLSMDLAAGEIFGLVGESGCGKSMTALSIMGLLPPAIKNFAGEIVFQNQNLLTMKPQTIRKLRGSKIGMIFQEPMTALNPVFTIGRQVQEVFLAHTGKGDSWNRSIAILEKVGLPGARQRAKSYPHQLSGGLRQRVVIAMALALNPELVLADEPTTALDVTIQAQIIKLLADLTRESGSACLLITHNLAVVASIAEKVGVMYAGRLMEMAEVNDIFKNQLHPYTKGLLACLPALNPSGRHLPTIRGTVPNFRDIPENTCVFLPRCDYAVDICKQAEPQLYEIGPGHKVRCFLHHQQGN